MSIPMKLTFNRKTLGVVIMCLGLLLSNNLSAQYNYLWIPDTLSGKTFDLNLLDSYSQLRPGNQTITAGVNNKFWGSTLFFNKGDTVHINVQNSLNDSTTIHWHGFHLPAVMDGGPHQVIPPGTIWKPYWKVTNNAATYWYHPHLHEMTQEQMTKGVGGFIIVRDDEESKLVLPRTYGVDDIPLALTSRRYGASNAFVYTNTSYGDYMLTNGTPNAQVSLPKQYVRLRILNAEMERAYNLGFSDNRTFYLITTDGGLVNAPIPLTRIILGVGERAEILVDLNNDAVGSSIDLKAYNSGFTLGFPGGEPNTGGQFGSLLNNKVFTVLHINIAPTTSNPITTKPTILANNTYWTASDATVNRTVTVTGGQGPNPFTFDNSAFALTRINKTVEMNTVEKWTITNNNIFGHSFHIHDVQFKIISRSNGPVSAYEEGWKDVLFLPINASATFVAKFADYSDSIHPFMYHCHFAPHEDAGMMGQFVVKSNYSLNVSTNSIVIPSIANNTNTFDITSNTKWTIKSNQTWLSVNIQNGNGNSTITISAEENKNTFSRTALILVSGEGVTSKTITITQEASSPTLLVSKNSLTIAAPAKSTKSFDILSNVSWNIESDQPWLTPNKISGNGNETIELTALGNSATSTRIATITVEGTGVNSQMITVIQDGVGPTLTVSKTLFSIQALNMSKLSFEIMSNTSWKTTSNKNWLMVDKTSGSGDAVVHLSVEENTDTVSRTGTISVTASGVTTQQIIVNQEAKAPSGVEYEIETLGFSIYPNPAKNKIYVRYSTPTMIPYYVKILDAIGRTLYMLPRPQLQEGIDISKLSTGTYFVVLTDEKTKQTFSQQFIKE